ncbi:MAG: glutamyl-tRNA reductase [Epsilonproteobacteria bacterium]|nr:glutamyl-tRNA reductase [Campylobacterota bacterium]
MQTIVILPIIYSIKQFVQQLGGNVNLFSLGLSFKTTPVEIRECFSISERELYGILCKLHQLPEIAECMILSTCNRTEFFVVPSKNMSKAIIATYNWMDKNFDISDDWRKYARVIQGNDALLHIFRIGSSLDSEIIGEPQILGQLKNAYRASVETRTSGVNLNRIMRKTFMVSKRVRTETRIGEEPMSVSYAAVIKAKEHFGDIAGKKALLIGAGRMIDLAAKSLFSSGAVISYVANRTLSKALEIAEQYDAKALHINDFPKILKDVDIVISSTASKNFVINSSDIAATKADLLVLDIAVPRDADPAIADIKGITIFNIDDLEATVKEAMNFRKKEAEKAEKIVTDDALNFLAYIESMNYENIVKLIRAQVEDMRKDEVAEALKSFGRELSIKERKILDKMSKAIVEKILHKPTVTIRQYANDPEGDMYIEAIKQMYGISNKKSSDIKCFFAEAKELMNGKHHQ